MKTTPYDFEYVYTPEDGFNYYRIKQVDFDGSFEYSNIAFVNHESGEFRIYPIPVEYRLFIKLSCRNSLHIYDHIGTKIKQFELH